jgi:methyltransferase-like protein
MMSNPFVNHDAVTPEQHQQQRLHNRRDLMVKDVSIDHLARITIYCHTGTIMTSRILNGCVRNLFRKNVTSLDIVERCLRDPPELPTIDWNLIGHANHMDTTTTTGSSSSTVLDKVVQSIPNNLELIDVGIAILTSERDKLIQHAKTLEYSKVTSTTTKATTTYMEHKKVITTTTTTPVTTTTGMEFQFSLSAGPMKHVDQCLHDINEMGKLVKWVATNGIGTVFLYGNGGVAYTPNIPQPLYQRLSQLRSSKLHSCRPKYVTLGTKDRYFVTFHDNTFHYSKGMKVLDRELKKLSNPPLSVAFGSTYDAFCIVYDDGTYKHHGRGIPNAFIERLAASTTTSQAVPSMLLSSVTLGPSGEWFIRYQDRHTINFLDFGENGSYFVSYD